MIGMCLLHVNITKNFLWWPNETLHEEVVTSKNYCELLAASME